MQDLSFCSRCIDTAVVFVYDIHPLAKTLFDSHLSQTALSAAVRNTRPGKTPHLPERVLWSYIIQLANVIATVHAHKLAVRTIELSKILVTGRHRLRVSGCGMLDVIRCDWNNEETLPKLQVCPPPSLSCRSRALLQAWLTGSLRTQHADFLDLGAVILALACNTPHAVYSLSQSMDRVSKIYSPDVHNLLMFLFTKQHDGQTIDQLFVHIGSRVLDELNGAFSLVGLFWAVCPPSLLLTSLMRSQTIGHSRERNDARSRKWQTRPPSHQIWLHQRASRVRGRFMTSRVCAEG